MDDHARRSGGYQGKPPGKPNPSPGISRAEFDNLKTKIAELDTRLSEALNEKNQWNTVLREWQDKGKVLAFTLLIAPVSGNPRELLGRIQWIDRYTIGIEETNPGVTYSPSIPGTTIIIHKGAIATIRVYR